MTLNFLKMMAVSGICCVIAANASTKLHKALYGEDAIFAFENKIAEYNASPLKEKIDKLVKETLDPANIKKDARAEKFDAQKEKFIELLKKSGLEEGDLESFSIVCNISEEQIKNIKEIEPDDNKLDIVAAVDFSKAVDGKALFELFKTAINEEYPEAKCEVAKFNDELDEFVIASKDDKVKVHFLVVEEGKSLLFGTNKGVKGTLERFAADDVNYPAKIQELRKGFKPGYINSCVFVMPAELQNVISEQAVQLAEKDPMTGGVVAQLAKVKGVCFSERAADDGFLAALYLYMPTKDEATMFKGSLLDGMLLPMVQMMAAQYLQGNTYDTLAKLQSGLNNKFVGIETMISLDDMKKFFEFVKEQAGKMQERLENQIGDKADAEPAKAAEDADEEEDEE